MSSSHPIQDWKDRISLQEIISLSVLKSLDPVKITALHSIEIYSLGQLLNYQPIHNARHILAVARGQFAQETIVTHLLDAKYRKAPSAQLPSAPVDALMGISHEKAAIFERYFNLKTVEQLASFQPFMEAQSYLAEFDHSFYEPASAPDELLPKMTGAITSLYRYSSFIRDRDLRGLKIILDRDCVPETILAHIFEEQHLRCPVIYLGRLVGYRQQWVMQGTNLGEVRHSLALAPGESRNIAIVDWRRAQRTGWKEESVGKERLVHFARHQRTVDEAAGGVASEHQWGWTETAAVTAAGALGAVAAFGIAGGVGGALGGAALGSLFAGVGALPGAAGGAIAGGFAGVASAGLAVAGAGALGMIRADTNGGRDVEGEAAQDIMLTTRQKSSVERSLRASSVLEDVQSEQDNLQTSTITNYNHMHALTVQYYEILHRYGVSIELDTLEPLLFLPFAALPFDPDNFEHLWPFIRTLFSDAEMVQLVDEKLGYAEMKIKKVEVEIPDVPEEPISPDSLEIRRIKAAVRCSQPYNDVTARLVWKDDTGATRTDRLRVLNTTPPRIVHFDSKTPELINVMPLLGTQMVAIEVTLGMQFPIETSVEVTVTAHQGTIGAAGEEPATTVLKKRRFYPASDPSDTDDTKRFPWNATEGLSAAYQEYETEKEIYDKAVQDAGEADMDYQEAIQARIEKQDDAFTKILLLANGRRFSLTREYLQQAEPEVLAVLLDSLMISDGNQKLPLHRVAHSVPIAVAGSYLILKMKRMQGNKLAFPQFPEPEAAPIVNQSDLILLTSYPQWVIERFQRLSQRPLSEEIIDMPATGLFAEAILGRSNAAEKLDLTRHVAWHEMPIPHQPPAIAALTAGSRAQSQDVRPSIPPNTINIVSPPSFPDPSGLSEVFATLRTSDMFRDMSKSKELASIIGNLTQLAGSLGETASHLTGDAASRVLDSAGEIGKVASSLANQAMLEGGRLQSTTQSPTQTSLGSRINALKE